MMRKDSKDSLAVFVIVCCLVVMPCLFFGLSNGLYGLGCVLFALWIFDDVKYFIHMVSDTDDTEDLGISFVVRSLMILITLIVIRILGLRMAMHICAVYEILLSMKYYIYRFLRNLHANKED